MTPRMRLAATMILAPALLGCGGRQAAWDADDSTSGSTSGDGCVPTGDTELCDDIDNDCDGQVDEDIAPLVCGIGSCEVVVYCEAGQMPDCEPGEPAPESCNLLDDNCDGQVDEGLGFGPLGDVIALRTDEFDTGSCTSCRWAWGTALAPTTDGFVSLWNLGLNGGAEQPTLYGRFVDGAGVPLGPVELLRDDFLVDMYPIQALAPMPAMGLPLAIEHRTQGQEDVSGLLFAAPEGATEVVKPIPGGGPQNVERTVWTGERFISAWEQDNALQIAVLHPDGALDHMVDVDPLERPARITLGVFPGRVGLMVSRVRIDLELWDQWFVGLDAFGNVEESAHPVDVEYTSWQRVVGTEDGWLHIRPNNFDEASTRQPLDLAGDPIDEALPFADGRHLDDSGLSDTFVPRPGLHEMITAWASPSGGDMHVEFLDGRGDFLRGWSGPLPPDPGFEAGYLVEPHIQFATDRVLVIWHGLAQDEAPNRVFVRSFGCVPPPSP